MADEGDITKGVIDAIISRPEPVQQQPVAKADPRPVPEGDDNPIEDPVGDEPAEDDELAALEDDGEEQEAADEPQPKIAALDDDVMVEVTVDGQKVLVPAKELKSSYSGKAYIDKQIQEASTARKAAEERANQVIAMGQQTLGKLQQLDNVLKAVAEPNIDWEKLKAENPQEYILRREEVREAQEQRQRLAAEAQQIQHQQQILYQEAEQRYLTDQAQALMAKLPELAHPEKGKSLMESFVRGAKDFYGYSAEEVGGVKDHRAMLVLNDAIKYRQLLARKAEMKTKAEAAPVKTMIRPTASKPVRPAVDVVKRQEKVIEKARATGKPEDVALTMLAPRPVKRA